jgi:hypothetical protein
METKTQRKGMTSIILAYFVHMGCLQVFILYGC